MVITPWVVFILGVCALLALDLGVFHRKSRVVSITEAAVWTTVWVILSLLFNGAVYWLYESHAFGVGATIGSELTGKQAALQFFTGYVIEKSLSLDNIFVIAMIFAYFGVPAALQHRVLFWGILGALVMRGAMILGGVALIERFQWTTYVLGALLVLTAVKMLVTRHDNLAPERNPLVRLARRLFPVSATFEGDRFFTCIDGRRAITPLLLVLLVVESTDVLFAVDSIPAIFAVTRDPFIVFTSNVFAILGLRSAYFLLAGVLDRFRYLKASLVVLLAFVGVKMLIVHYYKLDTLVSLTVIGCILAVGVVASLIAGRRDRSPLASPLGDELPELSAAPARVVRRAVVALVGATVLLIGLGMVVLPGPAVLVVPAGLAILGTEFLWARRLLERARGVVRRGRAKGE